MAPRLIVIAALGFALTGCVAESKYNALKLEKDQAIEAANAAQTARAAAEAEAASWKTQLNALMDQSGQSGTLVARYMDENKTLHQQYDDLLDRYNKLVGTTQGLAAGPLPAALSAPLEDLARQYPDILEFDRDRGMIKFKSDVTFASGSAELTPQAKTVIAKLAQILNSSVAANYEMLVAGHTDNARVVRAETIREGHKDNWYLSAHRAITVGAELISHSVSPRRLGALGYADQRPVASNATPAGQAKNRRVEVLLLPTTYRAGGSAIVETPTKAPVKNVAAPKATAQPMNKDSLGGTDQRPIFQK